MCIYHPVYVDVLVFKRANISDIIHSNRASFNYTQIYCAKQVINIAKRDNIIVHVYIFVNV